MCIRDSGRTLKSTIKESRSEVLQGDDPPQSCLWTPTMRFGILTKFLARRIKEAEIKFPVTEINTRCCSITDKLM